MVKRGSASYSCFNTYQSQRRLLLLFPRRIPRNERHSSCVLYCMAFLSFRKILAEVSYTPLVTTSSLNPPPDECQTHPVCQVRFCGRCPDEHSSEQMFFPFNDQLNVVFNAIDQSVTYVMRDVGILFEYATRASGCHA
jgi:hypothetical protein